MTRNSAHTVLDYYTGPFFQCTLSYLRPSIWQSQ